MKNNIITGIVFFLLWMPLNDMTAQILDISEIDTGEMAPKYVVGKKKIDFGEILYRDSLMNYFSILDTIGEQEHQYTVNAIYGLDTLKCYMSKEIYQSKTLLDNKKLDIMVVESQVYPHRCYQVIIQDLPEKEIQMLVDSVRFRINDPRPLSSAPQTCLSYAFECLFRFHGINPEPICYRRTYYPEMNQLNQFLARFCIEGSIYTARKKVMKDVEFPDHSVLIFRNENGEIIHGLYHSAGLFYSKNGRSNYKIYNSIIPQIDEYSRYGKRSYPNNDWKKLMATTITVYTLNKHKFN